MFSLLIHLGHMCKKFQVNRITFTMEKVSSNTQRQAQDFSSRIFPFCTRGNKCLCCDVNFKDIRLVLLQLL